ncbi:MAG: hypothetical protein K0S09_2949 [Sphingobacteriaceae bacterium]|jgi:hypothetical protein|nr:hypothetical protein [Sphingobacteriaceae bacterium]
MNNWFKRNGIHLAIIGIFIALCFAYFLPALQGKGLVQSDVLQAQAMQKEIMDFKAKDGVAPLWTNSMFGGMPAYQIWAQYPNNVATYVISFFSTVFPNPINVVLLLLLGTYFLFCVLRMNPWLAAAGAIAFTFTSYNFILIEAGHANQVLAIAFFAPIIAGILLTLRNKQYLLGAAVTALFLAVEIRSNHIQMTYYLFIALLVLMIVELVHAVRQKTTKEFFKSFGYLAVAALLAVAVNAPNLWTTYEYGEESQRGKSNLATDKAEPNTGLDREYAYQWSQGVAENFTFLVPNAYGGASGPIISEDSEIAKVLAAKGVPADQISGFLQQGPRFGLSSYWGEKQFTSGPFYFGAIIFFLFILGLFIVRDRIKWWVLSAFLLTLFLSFGRNLPFLSDIFFNYFPLYNKFRTVESILAVAGLLFPILAILAVKEIAFHTVEPKKLMKQFLYSLYITGGILLILIIAPTIFLSFKNSNHQLIIDQLQQVTGGDRGFAESIGNALVQDRVSLARADALRSLVFVLIGAALVWALIKQKIKPQPAFMILAAVILIDLWMVDRRYLNNDTFVDQAQLKQQFRPRQVDELILRDQSLDYRVLDLTVQTFQSAIPATYYHKTIGGYHPAKLKRYQEIIDKQFSGSINEDVLDMLNTKYLITSSDNGQSQKIENRATACGNAWFVPKLTYVKDANEEMTAISSFDPKKEAFVGVEFKSLIDEKKLGYDPNGMIKLTSYRPDNLVYEYSTSRDMVAVFAEVWYDKGWNAYVDGEKIPHFRANYILRAAQLPGGNHKLEFKFEPQSYYTGETIALIASILLIAGLAFALYKEFKDRERATSVKSKTA